MTFPTPPRSGASDQTAAVAAGFIGWMLDAFDVMLYSMVLSSLVPALGMTTGTAGLLGSLTLVASAVGGLIFGIVADRYGRTPLLKAVKAGSDAAAQLLLSRGANVMRRDYYQQTPLHEAAFSGNLQLLEILVRHGADVHAVNDRNAFEIGCDLLERIALGGFRRHSDGIFAGVAVPHPVLALSRDDSDFGFRKRCHWEQGKAQEK